MRLLVPLLLAVTLAGCGGGSTPAGPSPEQIVQQTTEATAAQKSFHFKLNVENPATSTDGLNLSFADGDVTVPDRLKAKVAGTFNGIPLTSQIVFAGPKQFLVNPLTGRWQSFATKTSPIAFFSPAKGVLAAIEGTTGLKLEGTQTVGGVECYDVRGTIKARALTGFLGNPPSDAEVGAQLLVGKDDSVLRRLELSGPIADGEPDDIVRTVELSRFGQRVAIEAPPAG
jgi:hypothetical protein